MYSHNDSSTGMLLKKGSKQTRSPKDVTGMLPALPRMRYARNHHGARVTAGKTERQ